jgi:hypothetical protein
MRHFTVVWQRPAQEELAELWINAVDRAAVTAVVELIDLRLAESPTEWGKEFPEGLRSLIVAPLKVFFYITEQDRLVTVTDALGI